MTRSSSAASIGCRPSSRIASQPVRRLPGPAGLQPLAQLAPAVQQPGAADRRALEPVEDPGRLVGVVDLVGPGEADEQLADALAEVGVERQRAQRVPEEASAQREDLVGPVGGLPAPAAWASEASRAAWARLTRWSCQETCTARSTSWRSTCPRGRSSAVQASRWARKASGSSPGRTGRRAAIPCFTALNRDRSFPAADRGPVLLAAFLLLASHSFRRCVGTHQAGSPSRDVCRVSPLKAVKRIGVVGRATSPRLITFTSLRRLSHGGTE